MADSTTGTVENLALVIANLSQSSEELKATIASQDTTIASLNGTIDSLKSDNEYLKNNNDLLREENAYLKRKLFGTRSEKMSYSQDQLSLFDETENECEPELLEDISYTRKCKMSKRNEFKLLRRRYGDTPKEFASKLGISERTLRKYENGQIEPSESVQLKLFELKEKLRVKVDLDATYYHILHKGNT